MKFNSALSNLQSWRQRRRGLPFWVRNRFLLAGAAGLALLSFWALRPARSAIEMSARITRQIRPEETLDLYGRKLTSVSVFAYDFDKNDDLRPARSWVDGALARLMADPKPGRPVFLTVVNGMETDPTGPRDGDVVLRVLRDPANRADHVRQIVALSARADGVEIDYESLLEGTRPYFSQFIQELRAALPLGKLLAVDCEPKTTDDDGPGGQAIDWRAIQADADIVKVLTASHSDGGSGPGPSAPLDKIDAATRLAMVEVPLGKLYLVLTQFGRDWPEGAAGRLIAYPEAAQIARSHGVALGRDPVSGDVRVDYIDENGTAHQIWVPDEKTLLAQSDVIQGLEVEKIDVGELGTGDPNFWMWAAANSVNPNAGEKKDNPAPILNNLAPSMTTVGDQALVVTVRGSSFIPGSVIRWDGEDMATTFRSPTVLTFDIEAGELISEGETVMTVFNPLPGGGVSGGLKFSTKAEHTAKAVAVPLIFVSRDPTTFHAGTPAFLTDPQGHKMSVRTAVAK